MFKHLLILRMFSNTDLSLLNVFNERNEKLCS